MYKCVCVCVVVVVVVAISKKTCHLSGDRDFFIPVMEDR